jgi:methyl-accepting chemotaxis protein
MKRNITIGTKLLLICGALFAIVLALSYSSLTSISDLVSDVDVTANKSARKVELAGQIKTGIYAMRWAARGVILATIDKDTPELQKSAKDFQTAGESIRGALAEMRPLLVTERGKQAADDLERGLAQWLPLGDQLRQLCTAGRLAEADQIRKGPQRVIGNAMQRSADEIIVILKQVMAEATDGALGDGRRSRWVAGVLVALSVVVGIGVLLVIRHTNVKLRQFASEFGEGAEQVASAAAQVASASQSLAQGASEQASSLEETSASSEEINAMTRKNAENSSAAAQLTAEVDQRVANANQTLGAMVSAMDEINTSSDKISKIIKVIDEIAFQTNILALNAAVEAARAGEAGMGFAVVADEVRSLAQRCSQAAKDTAALIEDSVAKSRDGKVRLDQVESVIRSITESVAKVKMLVDDVNVSSQEQSRGIDQIARAILQMEQVTQQTAASAEEGAAASEELTAQSEAVHDVAGQLIALVGRGAAHASERKPVRPRGKRKSVPGAGSEASFMPSFAPAAAGVARSFTAAVD